MRLKRRAENEALRNIDDKNMFSPDMLTIKELRTFPGFERISDEEASDTINSLYQLSHLSIQAIDEETCKQTMKSENKKEVSE